MIADILTVYFLAATVATLAMAVLAWRHWRAGAPERGPGDDDMDAIVEAVTTPHTVFTVERLHTGALRVTGSALTVGEANDIGCQLIQAANDALWEHVGIHQAEEYANGDQT